MGADSVLLSGVFGFAYGFLLQKGDFCFVSAFRDWFSFGSTRVLRGILVLVAIAVFGWGVSLTAGWAPVNRLWLAPVGYNSLLGGLIFGVGMTIAGGCASGTLYRAGMGYIHFWITLAFTEAAYILFAFLYQPFFVPNWFQPLKISGPVSLFTAWKVPYILTGAMVLALIVALTARRSGFQGLVTGIGGSLRELARPGHLLTAKSWDTRLVGGLLGVMVVLQFIFVSIWGITSAEARISALLIKPLVGEAAIRDNAYFGGALFGKSPLALGGGEFLIIFMVVGAFAASVLGGTFRVRLPRLERLPGAAVGGILMGLGSRLAPGCNVGNVVSGLAGLSAHSVLATAGIAGGVLLTTYFLFGENIAGTRRVRVGA